MAEEEKKDGEATSSSLQDKDGTKSARSDGDVASPTEAQSGEATSSSLQDKDGTKSAGSDGDVASPAEPSPAPAAEKPAAPDWKTLYALTLADFDNYKKRAARDREDVYRYAESDILKDVLPAVDDLELALGQAKDKKDDPFVKGVQMAFDKLAKSLKDHGAEPFDSVGKDLDTEKMEAIAHLPSADVPEGKVSIESKKGWMLKGKVLRAAQVVVSSGKPE